MAKQVKRAKSFSFDLLADWVPYATPPGPADVRRGWVLHGTATLNGVTGALAFRAGWYGIAVGSTVVVDLGMWERIDVSHGIEFMTAPGWESVPRFVCENPLGTSTQIDYEEYWLPPPPVGEG